MRFRNILIIIAVITYLLLLFFSSLNYSTDVPNSYGFPISYKISGCYFGGRCIDKFYKTNLVIDIIIPLLLLLATYKIGNKFNEASLKTKIVIGIIFPIAIIVLYFIFLFFGLYVLYP